MNELPRMTLYKILDENKNLNFVQRIINPETYPVMPRPDLGEGKVSTHSMAWGEDKSGSFVYPEIIFNPKTRELQRLDSKDAINYAITSGELIRFDTPEEAEWFSKNYKKIWE